ncbi:LacI family transcriptional regulator [Paenibacillus alkaliterrae]|uniref:LacI family DNA-binding transcriptional regulator n=1 Tax=Paenibacillus alkaliterrae TaxID=320909 RepID=UPI001F461036|nr:LacI family DNA-binding transcriptional regulator [Paenibacillus alkaliterrae]MCF2939705.1 LacI family transcriptional regulator [Paenibacillus alkaliterrae]
MKATIYDVAREAGVSIATVSKVINAKGKISQERREEIFAIMERLHYQPSVIASALTGKHTFTLGLLIPDIANPFFGEVARAVEDRGHQLGYSVIICSTDNKDERIEQYISVLKQKRVDGIIIGTGMENTDILRDLGESMPVVIIGREVSAVSVHTVVADDWQGGRSAAEHLLLLGHRRMAVLSESLTVSSSRERLHGFKQRLGEEGVMMSERHVRPCKQRMEDGKREAAALLQGSDRPTAIFCCNDLLAVGALQAAKEAGIRVPSELSVVSFDNTILASVTDPPLTSIAQPMEQLGASAVDLLLEQFAQEAPTVKHRIALRTELIVRESTACVNLAYPIDN